MYPTRRWAAAAAVGLSTLLTLTACGSTAAVPGGRAEAEQSITVYNAQHEELTQAWADAFTAQSGVEVVLRNGSDAELGNQIVQEGKASPADVFLTENSPAISLVDNANLLAPVDQATVTQVPKAYRPTSGNWAGIAARSTVFVYNPAQLSEAELPASLMDLADPEWQGRWGASPSGADFQAIVSAVLELEGRDATAAWLSAMKQNSVAHKGNIAVMKAVNAGELDGGVIYHYYWYGDQAGTKENSTNTKLHYFKNSDPGAFVSVSGGGVLASSDRAADAQAFLAFVTSKAGQDVLRTGTSFEYPVASKVAANPALVPLKELEAPKVDPSKLNSTEVTDLMTEAGLL